ncbi:MAG: phosphoenolpyruvate carboxykinase [ATP] 1 [Chloroflexota bacterium]|nr:phosphoenolpyruvate carboxykinase (ATP) [Chloroflexota bacterium]NOG62400.1 phosphoenolpyruvate carboxykinase (ATP) [Chloroflexota bacterium]GIK64093.1 MAG: phosphoenolpyruvate carboxykinase [ATP] 1 [Chloroflexota bacterium]
MADLSVSTSGEHIHVRSHIGLEEHGFEEKRRVYWNLNPAEFYEHALRNGEGILTDAGALRVLTGQFTGRSPKDKYIVDEPEVHEDIWWGNNQAVTPEVFDRLYERLRHYLLEKELYVVDAFAGTDVKCRLPIRIISEAAYHGLFSWNMFVRPTREELAVHEPAFTVLAAPNLGAKPEEDGTRTPTFIGISFSRRMIIILGTLYSGEVKKGIFTVMNYLMPNLGIMPMHCSANIGPAGDTAVFFGLSGTGKTTLSADSSRTLIGDDEHGWSDDGIFNFEGGCYAKTIKLSAEKEPEIYATTQRFGTILENVPLDPRDRRPDFNDDSLTENTRCSYPIDFIPNASETGLGGHPENIIFLTADAFGVLPPVSKLTPEQAMYHFISGYTAKVAGTERGVTEPSATFSACFGAPFMPLHPTVYAELLAEKIREHGSNVWLINTGWSGGPYGVGSRIDLPYTRRMIHAALEGELDKAEFVEEPFFGLHIPKSIQGVPSKVLNPRDTWPDPAAYDAKARELAAMFRKNFEKFADRASEAVKNAGPKA